MEFVDPYGWHALDQSLIRSIQDRLKNFESMTWSEILVRDRKFNHTVEKSQLCQQARARLTQLKLDDIDGLVSLRLTGVRRVWGIQDNGILMLLWWDPSHQVCPSLKKYT